MPRADAEVTRDEVGSSRDPGVPRRALPKPLVVALGLLVAAVVVVLCVSAVTPEHHTVAVRPSPVPSGAGGQAATSCALEVSTPAMTFHRADWPAIDAPSRPAAPGITVLAWSVTPLLRVDLATGEVTRPVMCTGPVDGVFPVAVPWARVMNVTQQGHRQVWWVDGTNHLAEVPAGTYAVPGHDGSLLVVTATQTGQNLARYTSLERSPAVRPLGPSYSLVGEVMQGLVVREPLGASPDSTSGELLVVDPRTGRVVRDYGSDADEFPAVQGDRVAWVVSLPCRTGCVLRVADLASGRTTDTQLPGTSQTDGIGKAFSPDGSNLAVSYAEPNSTQRRVGVVSLPSSKITWISGIASGRTGYAVGTTWSTDGRTLVLSTSNRTFGRFALWDVTTHQLTAMPWVVAQDISQDLLSTVGAAGNGLEAWGTP